MRSSASAPSSSRAAPTPAPRPAPSPCLPSSASGFTLTAGIWQVYVRVTGGTIDQQIYAGPLSVSAGPWSYSGNPASSDRDAVRFWLDDTASPALFSDAEIDFVLAAGTASPLDAASQLAERLAMSYARLATSESVGDVSRTYGDRSAAMLALAKRLQARAASDSGEQVPAALGLASDQGYLVESYFWRGMLDNPHAPAPDTWTR